MDELRCEAAALPFFAEERPLRGALGLLDWRLRGYVSRLRQSGRVTGARGETLLLPTPRRTSFDKLFLFGLGARAAFDEADGEDEAARMLATLEKARIRVAAFTLPGRSVDALAPDVAMAGFLRAAASAVEIDEVVILEGHDAQRAMEPVIERARRRARAVDAV